MWIVAALVISVTFIASALPTVPQFLLALGVNIVMGLHGNDLLGWSLKRRGHAEIALSNGGSMEEAELRFYAEGVAAPALASPSSMPVNHDVLGLFGTKS
jgi:hypothetical protein